MKKLVFLLLLMFLSITLQAQTHTFCPMDLNCGFIGNNAQTFGVVGNGTTDDTVALQAALNNTCNGTVPGVLTIQSNFTVLLSSSIQLPSHCRLTGGATITYLSTGVNAPISPSTYDEVDHITFNALSDIGPAIYFPNDSSNDKIHDITINNDPNGGIYFAGTNVNHIQVYNINLNGGVSGPTPPIFDIQGGPGASYIQLYNVHAQNEGSYAIGFDGSNHININNVQIVNGNTSKNASGIQMEASNGPLDSINISNFTVSNFAMCASCVGLHVVATNQNASNIVVSNGDIHNGGRGIVFETVGTGTIKQASLSNFIVHDIGLSCTNFNWSNMIVIGGVIYNCGENHPGNGDTVGMEIGGVNNIISDNDVFDNQSSPTTGYSYSFGSLTHGTNNLTGVGTSGVNNPYNLINGNNSTYSVAITANPTVLTKTLPDNSTFILSVQWQPAGGGGTYTVIGGTWFLSTWSGFPATVNITGVTQLANINMNNALGATIGVTGLVNSQFTVTASGAINGTMYIYLTQIGSLGSAY